MRSDVAEMIRMRVEDGALLREIAEVFGLSRERVRRLLVKEGVTEVPHNRNIRRVLCAYSPSKSTSEIAADAGVSADNVRSTLNVKQLPRAKAKYWSRGSKYTAEILAEHMLTVSVKVGHTATAHDLIAASPPAHMEYYKVFGSLTAAARYAGLEPNKSGAAGHL